MDHREMTSHAEDAAAFARNLAEFAARLASKQIVVTSIHGDWRCFGSWTLRAQTEKAVKESFGGRRYTKSYAESGQEIIQVLWDGRERLLDITSATTNTAGGGGKWKAEVSARFEKELDVFDFAEQFVSKRLGV